MTPSPVPGGRFGRRGRSEDAPRGALTASPPGDFMVLLRIGWLLMDACGGVLARQVARDSIARSAPIQEGL